MLEYGLINPLERHLKTTDRLIARKPNYFLSEIGRRPPPHAAAKKWCVRRDNARPLGAARPDTSLARSCVGTMATSEAGARL
ncbi:hypothetical protein EVAR_8338_1 [Eumeta japonica]|uniref:Uncharacterized protein n=1 Tax=Eumeta variegata TaxID=151549 RepID=A0A4C1VFQ0_EUMVA|nr:hypothetical protein EVAR_8338_1 [Eumeta japonica]